MHSRTSRRTAMIPPWPVSPSRMTGIFTLRAIHLANSDAFGHRQNAEIGKARIVAAGDAGADEASLDAVGFHDLRVKSIGRAEHGENFILTAQQLGPVWSSVSFRIPPIISHRVVPKQFSHIVFLELPAKHGFNRHGKPTFAVRVIRAEHENLGPK